MTYNERIFFLHQFAEAIKEEIHAAFIASVPSSSGQEDFKMSNVLINPVLKHVKVLEISIGILFYCCILVCLSEVCSKVVPECLISGKWVGGIPRSGSPITAC